MASDRTTHRVYGKLHLARLTGDSVCFPLVKRITQFGRHSTSDVRIYDATVSKIHAELLCLSEEERGEENTPAKLIVHSANGIIIDGTEWPRGSSAPLRDGAVIDISGRAFTFEAVSTENEQVVVQSPQTNTKRQPRLSLIKNAQIETPTKPRTPAPTRRTSFLANFVAATPFSLFSPLLRDAAQRSNAVEEAGEVEGVANKGDTNEIDLMSWTEEAQSDGRDVIELDEQPSHASDSDSDSSDEDSAYPAQSPTPSKSRHVRRKSLRLTISASPTSSAAIPFKPITPARPQQVGNAQDSSDEEIEHSLVSPKHDSLEATEDAEEQQKDEFVYTSSANENTPTRPTLKYSGNRNSYDSPETPPATSTSPNRLPMSLGRKHSLREKVLIRGAIKAHNAQGKMQRSLSLGAVPAARSSPFRPVQDQPASVPLTMADIRQRSNDGQLSQPTSYFDNHDSSSSSGSDDEEEAVTRDQTSSTSQIDPTLLAMSPQNFQPLIAETTHFLIPSNSADPTNADQSPDENSMKQYFASSASSSDDDDQNPVAEVLTRRTSPRRSLPPPSVTQTPVELPKPTNPAPQTPPIRRRNQVSDLDALLSQQKQFDLTEAVQDLSPRAQRALRRSSGVPAENEANSIPDDLAQVRRELELEALGIELVPTLESVQEAAQRKLVVVDAYQTPSKLRAGPRKSALKQTPGNSPETARIEATPVLGKRKVVVNDELDIHEIACRADPAYIAEQETIGVTCVVNGAKRVRMSPRFSGEGTLDSPVRPENVPLPPTPAVTKAATPSKKRSPARSPKTPKTPGRARRAPTANPPVSVQRAFNEMQAANADDIFGPRTTLKPQRTSPTKGHASPGRALTREGQSKPDLSTLLSSPVTKLNAAAFKSFSPIKLGAPEDCDLEGLRTKLRSSRVASPGISLGPEHFGLSPVKEVPLNDAHLHDEKPFKSSAITKKRDLDDASLFVMPSTSAFTPNLQGVAALYRLPKEPPPTPNLAGMRELFKSSTGPSQTLGNEQEQTLNVLPAHKQHVVDTLPKKTHIPALKSIRPTTPVDVPVLALPRRATRAVKADAIVEQKTSSDRVFSNSGNKIPPMTHKPSRVVKVVPKVERSVASTGGRVTRSKAAFPEKVTTDDLTSLRSGPRRATANSEKENIPTSRRRIV